jgi:hypothetical protein
LICFAQAIVVVKAFGNAADGFFLVGAIFAEEARPYGGSVGLV